MQLSEQWQVLAGVRRGDYRTENLSVAADGTRTVRLYNAQETTPSLAVLYKPRQDVSRSEEHTSELQSRSDLVCRLLLEKNKAVN